MRVERDIYHVLRYSFTFILAAMFTFITIFNILTMVQSDGAPLILYLSIANNIVGVFSLVPVYMAEKWAWKAVAAWVVFYLAYLSYNVLSGWVVNDTGYIMLFFGIALALTLRKGEG